MSSSRLVVQQVLAILAKDVQTEWRRREIFISMFVFTILVVVVFNFAIGADPEAIRRLAPGVLWVALLFATVLGLQRAAQMESEEDCLQGVLLALGDRSALFIAKTAANMLYLAVVVVCALPLFSILFRIEMVAGIGALGVALLLGMLGLSTVGTLFAMLTVNTRTREVMLPLLFLPVSVPLTIAAVYATTDIIAGKGLAEITDYLTLMGVFDLVFLVVAVLVFDYVVEES
jgi:heme exporter protein B